MKKQKYIDDLKDIKDIMERSSRFISLSGLSGISAGISALIGAYFGYRIVFSDLDDLGYDRVILPVESLTHLLLIAVGVLAVAISTGIIFTTRETKKRNLKIWDLQTKRLLINLAIPLVTGGIISLVLLFQEYVGIVIPLSLVFYGLALVNSSKYTLNEVRSLGLIEILLGLLALYFISSGLLFWSIGFGVVHIVYGVIMQLRYTS